VTSSLGASTITDIVQDWGELMGDSTTHERLLAKAQSVLQPNQRCIINPDIDGILSALVLQSVLDWRAVGWYDSRDTLWISNDAADEADECVYIDVFVVPEGIRCIDQHIVAIDAEHCASLAANSKKVNPNIERVRYASPDSKDPNAYAWKYPFGSVHFIIAMLEALGQEVSIDLTAPMFGSLNAADVILRADDAARTTAYRYKKNAADWWGWLTDLGGPLTAELAAYALGTSKAHADDAYAVCADTFKNVYGCQSADGGFGRSIKNLQGGVDDSKRRLLADIAEAMRLAPLTVADRYTAVTGTYGSMPAYNIPDIRNLLAGNGVFSYAFISCMGPAAFHGFSYTFDMPIEAHKGIH